MSGKAFEGKWVFDRKEGMEAVLGALNLPADKVPKSGENTLEFKGLGSGSYLVKAFHPKSGKEFETTVTIGERKKAEELSAWLGQDIYATASWDGPKLVVTGEAGKMTITREIIGDELVTTFNAGGVVGKRFHKRA